MNDPKPGPEADRLIWAGLIGACLGYQVGGTVDAIAGAVLLAGAEYVGAAVGTRFCWTGFAIGMLVGWLPGWLIHALFHSVTAENVCIVVGGFVGAGIEKLGRLLFDCDDEVVGFAGAYRQARAGGTSRSEAPPPGGSNGSAGQPSWGSWASPPSGSWPRGSEAGGVGSAGSPWSGSADPGRTWSGAGTRDFGGSYERHTPAEPAAAGAAGRSPYDVLGVSASATEDEIKRAYRRKVAQKHPDRAGRSAAQQRKAHARMVEINAAYERLMKERRR